MFWGVSSNCYLARPGNTQRQFWYNFGEFLFAPNKFNVAWLKLNQAYQLSVMVIVVLTYPINKAIFNKSTEHTLLSKLPNPTRE